MRISIYLREPYPIGMACTKRIHLYAKGLIACGNEVKIILPKATETIGSCYNKSVKGIFQGVPYQYSSRTTIRSKYFFTRRVQDFTAFLRSLIILISSKPDIVLLTGSSYIDTICLFAIKLFSKWKFILERSEVPYFNKTSISFINRFFLKKIYSLYDGFIVISEKLKVYLETEIEINRRYHITPILVEPNKDKKEYEKTENIVYTGSLLDYKDGIVVLLKAFSVVLKSNHNIKLVMTGDIEKSRDKKIIIDTINTLKITEFVKFTGYISQEKLTELTYSAKILILAKPLNRQNMYNSATKIGEYLLTGRPVILSNVDTASEELEDNIDVFLAEPSVKAMSEKMKYVISNYEMSLKVGENGKRTAIEKFGFKNQTKNIHRFLKSICQIKK